MVEVSGRADPAGGAGFGARYELSESIGTGGGPVRSWRAYDSLLRRSVRLDVHEPGGPSARQFMDCGLAAAAISHPSLARVLDAVDEGSRAYVVSAWVDGTPLTALLADGPLQNDQAIWLMAQLAGGVATAHAHGTTLGLRGPDHVFLTASDTVTLTRVPLPGPTPQDDVRGLGALLYACLTACWPLSDRGGGLRRGPVSGGRLVTPAQLRAGVPADLSTLAMRALYPDQPHGIATAAELRDELQRRIVDPDIVPFALPAATSGPPSRRRRSRALTLAAPVLGLITVAVVAILIARLVSSMSDSSGAATREPLDLPSKSTTTHSSSESSAPASKAAPKPVHPVSVASFNPYNQPPGDDNADQVGATMDGNQQTYWETENYFRSATFGNLKPGVGLLYDFGKPVDIKAIKFTTPTPGITLEVRSADASSGSIDGYARQGSPVVLHGPLTMKLPGSAKARYWMVWLTSLAPSTDGQFHGGLDEVDFLS
ncbi:MAG TPA: protein kinase family protein [Mycobacteriales bacterium]|nr:protein kinase family protein [Mycobacteriales bacterium]